MKFFEKRKAEIVKRTHKIELGLICDKFKINGQIENFDIDKKKKIIIINVSETF